MARVARINDLYRAETGRQRTAFVDCYGCQQNEADAERMRGMLVQMGYAMAPDEHGADAVVINTCAVREHAEMRVLGNVGALSHDKKARPDMIIAVGGCMPQQESMSARLRRSFPMSISCSARTPSGVCRKCFIPSSSRTTASLTSKTRTATLPRASPSCVRTTSAAGSASCTAATTSARTASSPTCAAANAAAVRGGARRSARAAGRRLPRDQPAGPERQLLWPRLRL